MHNARLSPAIFTVVGYEYVAAGRWGEDGMVAWPGEEHRAMSAIDDAVNCSGIGMSVGLTSVHA